MGEIAGESDSRGERMTALEPGSDPSSMGDEVVSAVTNEKRRRVLQTLAGSAEQAMAFEDVVDALDEHIGDDSDDSMDRHHLGVALHHVHLPHLESAGLVERPEKTRVRLADEDRVRSVLELIEMLD